MSIARLETLSLGGYFNYKFRIVARPTLVYLLRRLHITKATSTMRRVHTMKHFSKLAVLIDVIAEQPDFPHDLLEDMARAAKLCKCLSEVTYDLYRENEELRAELAQSEFVDNDTVEPREGHAVARALAQALNRSAKRARDANYHQDREFERIEQIRHQKRKNEKGNN